MKLKKALLACVLVLSVIGFSTAVSAVSEMLFPDVEEGSWYEDAANWAGEAGLITGMDGNFVPEGNVTRAQLATIMYRFDQYLMTEYGLMGMEDDMMDEEDEMEDDIDEEMMYDYTDLSAADAKALVDSEEGLVIIDVSPVYADGHLPGAVNYPVGDGTLEATVPTLDAEGMYLVYCHGEAPSRQGAQMLTDAGFTNVYRLDGDYGAWVDAGYDVEM